MLIKNLYLLILLYLIQCCLINQYLMFLYKIARVPNGLSIAIPSRCFTVLIIHFGTL